MTVDTTFSPQSPCYLVGATAVQVAPKELSAATSTYRVRCLVTAYLTWGPSNVAAAGAPAAGAPSANTIGQTAGSVCYLQLPPGIFFIASAAAAFEITAGQGGAGGQ